MPLLPRPVSRWHRALLGLAVVLVLARLGSLAWPAESLGATVERGDRLLLGGRAQEALPIYRAVARAGDWRGFERVARAEESLGQLEPALEAWLQARARRPQDPGVLAGVGRTALQVGRLDLAQDSLRHLLRERPGSLEARLLMARLEVRRSRPARAEAWLRRGLEINPRHNVFHFELGLVLAGRSAWAEAREHFAAAVGANPEFDAMASYQAGLASLHLSDLQGAEEAFRAATETNPRLAMPWYLLGQLLREGDPRASRDALRRFLELQPRGAEADEARRLLEGRP